MIMRWPWNIWITSKVREDETIGDRQAAWYGKTNEQLGGSL